VTSTWRLGLALAALGLPTGLGAAGSLVAAARGGGVADVLAPLVLALVALVPRAGPTGPADGHGPRGLQAAGRWRAPPAGTPHLETVAGPLVLDWPPDVAPPGPGTPIEVLARARAGRPPLAVVRRATGPPRGALVDRWHEACVARLRALLPVDARGVARALLLGDRRDLPHPVRAACVRTGTMHVLALSGLHVGLLAALLSAGARRLAWRIEAPCLLAFVALCGARPPLVRAALGWLLGRAARAAGRLVPARRRLATVALLMLVARPSWRDDLAFQLSFLAVFGLVVTRVPWWCGGLGAFLATAPSIAEHFGRLQPWGVVVTPLLVPPVAAILALGTLAVLPLGATSVLDAVWAPCLRGAVGVLEAVLAHAQALVPAPWTVHLPEGTGLPAGVAVVALLARHGARRAPRRAPP